MEMKVKLAFELLWQDFLEGTIGIQLHSHWDSHRGKVIEFRSHFILDPLRMHVSKIP